MSKRNPEVPLPAADDDASAPAPHRRAFFRWLTYGLGAVAGLLFAVPLLGYVVGTRKRRVIWVKLGAVSEFPENETRRIDFDNPLSQPWDGMVARTGVYVRYEGLNERQQDKFLVLAVNCTHLGCPVSWFSGSGLFLCPCHVVVYYRSGERASGPPPRGLYHCVWRVRSGQLEIQAPHYPTLHDTLQDSASLDTQCNRQA